MPVLSAGEIAAYWRSNGGDASNVIVAVAVALAESGGNPTAVSDTQDYGLWQINIVHQGDAPSLWTRIFEPGVNADFAFHISDSGRNWAPWATCYANIGQAGWSTYLAGPQPGSMAAAYMVAVAAALGLSSPVAPQPPPYVPPAPTGPGEAEVAAGWGSYLEWYNRHQPATAANFGAMSAWIGGIFS